MHDIKQHTPVFRLQEITRQQSGILLMPSQLNGYSHKTFDHDKGSGKESINDLGVLI